MNPATKKLTFQEYLALSDVDGLPENRCEFVNGEFFELPPESELNDWIARYLFLVLANTGVVPPRQIAIHTCELQVPVLKPRDPSNRYPDLVILRKEHLSLTQRRLTVTLDMPPPLLVAEVVSPGQTNRTRDYQDKLRQYQERDIPEYWLIDPQQQTIQVLEMKDGAYVEVGTFRGNELIRSSTFKSLLLIPEEIFTAG